MITKEYHEKIVIDVDEFNSFIADYTEIILRKVYLEIPKIVLKHIQETQRITALRENFYKSNMALCDHRDLVMQVANSIQSTNSDWDMEKIFDETAIKAKEILKKEEMREIGNDQGF